MSNGAVFNQTTLGPTVHLLRVACLAVSSHGVYLHHLFRHNPSLRPLITRAVDLAVSFCGETCRRVKEYPQAVPNVNVFMSSLECVSGEFHSPGGEDHVGCLALNRLCTPPGPGSPEGGSPLVEMVARRNMEDIFQTHQILAGREGTGETGAMLCTSKSRR